ncbi:MAG: FmdB family zinc ribbon protein [Actinomycetota bacterium]
MPIYEYACTACGERTEARQSFADPPLDTCPLCGGSLRKLYSPVGIVFKGSGFYSTDGKSSSGGAKGSESESKSSADKSKPSSDSGSSKKSTSDSSKSSKESQ